MWFQRHNPVFAVKDKISGQLLTADPSEMHSKCFSDFILQKGHLTFLIHVEYSCAPSHNKCYRRWFTRTWPDNVIVSNESSLVIL
ncbi:unnamed protein product [Rhizophagus irregularis]|nr:unnamed protein product [Rhizophagus irregularis]